jgi:aspartyl/glutamyl-tRNA(Asn/Gln) amidotransferase C subunit
MTKITKEEIDSLAEKLLIGLTPEENELVLSEFDIIEEDINLINEMPNIENIEPMTHPFDLYTATLREDEYEDSDKIEDILSNADETENREIKVPKVVE